MSAALKSVKWGRYLVELHSAPAARNPQPTAIRSSSSSSSSKQHLQGQGAPPGMYFPPGATTNLDSESKRTGHFRSSWQQHVNVLGSWSRPECVQDLHWEAQLNLQRLLQEFGEQLCDDTEAKRPRSLGSEGTPRSQAPTVTLHHEGPDPGCLVTSEQECVDQNAWVGLLSHDSPTSCAEHPRLGPPVPEKPHWLLRRFAPAHPVLTDATGEGVQIKGASCPRFLALSAESASRCLPLRKTYSDLPHREPQSPSTNSEMMENMAVMCSSWNGPRGSTFCPNWDSSFSPYLLDPDPVTMVIPQVREERRAQRVDGVHYRERSFSIPADSGSFSPGDRTGGRGREGEVHALSHPCSGSEHSSSPASTSTGAAMQTASLAAGRECSRSISLRKLKKPPLPPVRSVSLSKSEGGVTPPAKGHTRPKSLCIPRDLCNSLPPDVILSSRPRPRLLDTPLSRMGLAAASGTESSLPSQSKCSNPHRSPSSSSSTVAVKATAEVTNEHGSSESLPSPLPSPSSQNSPSQLSPEFKISPLKPPQLMSPSSGYSSLSDTPTPTVPSSVVMGPSPLGCRMRPKVPERKSSLPPASVRERAARARLSCEVPLLSRRDLPSGKPTSKASRRHSDSSAIATATLPQKLSPGQAAMPLVTETDLRNVRLRAVGHPEPEAGVEGGSPVILEEQEHDRVHSPPVKMANPKLKPPIAAKPVLPRRPLSLVMSPTPSSESPPTSPKDRPCPLPKRPLSLLLNPAPSPESSATASDRPTPLGNIYKVLRKRKSKKGPAPSALCPEGGAQECTQQLGSSDPQQEAEHPTTPSSPETRDKNRTLPTRMTISCLAELDRKQHKVPPPVPRKPSVLLLPANGVRRGVGTERSAKANAAQTCQDSAGPDVDAQVKTPLTRAETEPSQDSPEEDYDDVFVGNSTSHTTEDLFTIIHRSKRKVLGRKEPSDPFGSRQSLWSPAKAEAASDGSRSSSRNDTFMAMLQKRNGRYGSAGRPSAAEMLQSTNPLTRRATDCPPPDPGSASRSKPAQQR
ncbi:hypothetical protein SKAU_G00270710 [Synaphobranchus kaupii]|uniref:NHS-like protein 2 n=1 Tax=Synaphobranchus kaupii TaxID=118154 RepID=A0A9Q1IQC4_SYNKA|nr:hypothetical protein SKAU_G00270710 [Synaphobranchus kaupii]